jgi:hypothetical protein
LDGTRAKQRFPKPRAHVRFMPGALSKALSIKVSAPFATRLEPAGIS